MPLYNNQPYQNQYDYTFGVGQNNPNGYSANRINQNNVGFNQSPFNNIMVVPVNGQEGAESYPVAIGLTVMLLDYNNGIFWLKSNDGLSTKLIKHTFSVDQNNGSDERPKENIVSFEAFNKLSEKVDYVSKKVEDLCKNLGEND